MINENPFDCVETIAKTQHKYPSMAVLVFSFQANNVLKLM